MRYVIIGNSAAAVGCIEGIRKLDKTGSITVISSENYHTYSRPLISYLLCGKTTEQKMKYRPDSFYEDNKVALLAGKKAVRIDKGKKQVVLEDGMEIPYDKLLIATGSDPFIPPIEGIDTVEKKFTFMSLNDAKELEKAISPKSRVLIMGAGLIGLKCAEGIAGKVKSITVVDMADRILSSILDLDAASIVQWHIESKGIKFILSDSVVSFSPGKAVLKSGRSVSFDILVVAVGVRPNTKLAIDAGIEVARGIVTDEHCRTSADDIYAAGDCSESIDVVTGERRVLALLPNAYMQGECAGINMAGGDEKYNYAIAMNAIGFFGLHIITAGCYKGTERLVSEKNSYKKLFVDNGCLSGYILVGDVARAGIYTSLIRERVPLDTIDFELICEKPQLMAFSRTQREQMLGGVLR